MSNNKRVFVFIDEWNIVASAKKQFSKGMDWRLLRTHIEEIVQKIYGNDVYIAPTVVFVPSPPPTVDMIDMYLRKYGFIRWMRSKGFLVVSRDCPPTGTQTFKGDMDAVMAAYIMEHVFTDKIDGVVILSGDGDFCYMIERLRAHGVRVDVMACGLDMSNDLLLYADEVHMLDDLFRQMVDLKGSSKKSTVLDDAIAVEHMEAEEAKNK
jgi:uncharacterized LabA/DUF88 family protein